MTSLEPASEQGAGRVIGGRYRLLRCVGRGGMGEVWSALDTRRRALVAVKLLSIRPGRDLEPPAVSLRRFRFEADVGARLGARSSRVVAVHDFGLDVGGPFLVMEYVRGRTLRAVLDREGPLAVAAFAPILRQVGEALAAAHAAGIAHRDLKPANVLLAEGRGGALGAKLADFGVACAVRGPAPEDVDARSDDELVLGSPAYMSPEQILGHEPVDERTDLWSLGVLAYEALTGRRPFQGPTGASVTLGITGGAFPPARSLRPGLPRGLDAWCARARAKRPERRFASATEMVEAFERAVRLRRRARPLRRVRRAPSPVHVGVIAALIALIHLVASSHRATSRRPPAPERAGGTVASALP